MSPSQLTLFLFGAYGFGACTFFASESIPAIVTEETELMRSVVDLGSHKVTYIRVTPPQLLTPVDEQTVPASPQAPSSAEEQQSARPCIELSVTGIVYVGPPAVTELTWWEEGRFFRAWSNVDFRLLAQPRVLETEEQIISWTPIISDGAEDDLPLANSPAGLALFTTDETAPEFFFQGTEADMASTSATLAGLDYLHAYYQIHRARLAEDYTINEKEAAAKQARLAAEKAAPRMDEKVYFWKIE